MKLVKVELENFGIYENNNLIELQTPDNQNKLTLIVGKNGAGKTTLLNAIKTAFYGPLLFKVKAVNSEYQNYILSSLNNNAKKNNNSTFMIKVYFISNILGHDGEYSIKREWKTTKSKIEENITITKRESPLSPDESDDFLNIIHQNYPINLFDLFFFDGEKIDQLSVLNHDIVKVLETAFNLNHFTNLKNDLEKYAVNKVKNQDIKFLEDEKNEISDQIPRKESVRLNLQKELLELNNQFSENKLKIKLIGDENLFNSDSIDDNQIKILQKHFDDLIKIQKQHISDFVPFLAVKEELANLTKQLANENKAKKYEIVSKEMKSISLNELQYDLSDIDKDTIKRVIEVMTRRFEIKSDHPKIHNISNEDFINIRNLSKIINNYTYNDYYNLQFEINNKRKELELFKSIAHEKKSNEYKIKLDQLISLQENVAKLSIQIEEKEDILKKIESEIDELIEKREKIAQQVWNLLKSSNVDQLIIKTNRVLENYIEEIKTTKLNKIQSQTFKMFNSIIRKDNFIKNITLSESGIQFIDQNNDILTHNQISAGERQIFTICLLISILIATERVTPLVFDTLLGRLDKNHRKKIIKQLMDNATGQIIILATDSEIDDFSKNELDQWLNKKIEIDYYVPNYTLIGE